MNIRTLVLLVCFFTFGIGDLLNDLGHYEFAIALLLSPESEGQLPKCTNLVRSYGNAVVHFNKHVQPIQFKNVTCPLTDHDKLCDKLSINEKGCELRVFRKGIEGISYSGPPDASQLINFIYSQLRTKSINLVSLADLEQLTKRKNGVFVGAFETQTKLEIVYKDYVTELQGKVQANFTHSSRKEILEKMGTVNGVVFLPPDYVHKHLQPVVYNGPESRDGLKDFIDTSLKKYTSCGTKIKVLKILTIILSCVWILF